jgi:hypothetical protein
MSYESDCNDYAIHGNPQQDAMDYEENARHDRFDGWGDEDEDGKCLDCGSKGACECWRDGADLEDQLDHLLDDCCPICGDHDPYACECGCNDDDAVPF